MTRWLVFRRDDPSILLAVLLASDAEAARDEAARILGPAWGEPRESLLILRDVRQPKEAAGCPRITEE